MCVPPVELRFDVEVPNTSESEVRSRSLSNSILKIEISHATDTITRPIP